MLSLGWSEITIVLVIVILIIGPKELPTLLKQLGYLSKKIKSLSRDFNTSINNIIKETEIDQVQKKIEKVSSLDVKEEILSKTDTKSEFETINTSFDKLNKDINIIKDKTNK